MKISIYGIWQWPVNGKRPANYTAGICRFLHLDTHIKFVQYIKLAIQEAGLGTEWVREPRLPLVGAERESVLKIIHDGLDARPNIPAKTK